MHGDGPIGVGCDRNPRRERTSALVFVPTDRVVERGGRKHIQVAVTVEVRRMHGGRPVGVCRERMARRERAAALVFVPGDGVVHV